MSTSTPKMTNVEKEVVEDYASSLSDLTVNSKPLINMLTMLAHENITFAPVIVQTVERHLQQVPAERKLPVLYLIDSIVKNVGDTYTTLFTQNIVSTFCSVFEKVDEKTRAHMFKLRQTWNEVFPAKKLYAVDVRVNSIDPAWPITAVPPTIHVNPKFFRQQQPATTVAQTTTTTTTTTATTVTTTPSVSTVSATVTDDSQTINEAKMREQLLKKQKELLELQQKKLELELLQTKARLEEQQKQLDRQLRPENVPITNKKRGLHRSTEKGLSVPKKEKSEKKPLLSVIQAEAAKLITKVAESASSSSTKSSKSASSAIASKAVATTVANAISAPETVVTTAAAASSRTSGGASGSSKLKSETASTKTVSTTSRPITTAAAVATITPSVRSRDPRLASRQIQPSIALVNNSAQQQDEEMQEPDTVFEAVKLETTKPKPQITINLGCVNKGTVNKDSRGISKKDPRLISNKVHGISNSNVKGRTSSAAGGGASSKGGGKASSRGPSPSPLPAPSPLPSSPSRSSSSSSSGSSSGIGKTSTSPSPLTTASATSQRKTQNKNNSSNGNSKLPRSKVIPKIIKIDLTDSPPPKISDLKEENIPNKNKDSETSSKNPSPSKVENLKKKPSPVSSSRSSSSLASASTPSSSTADRKKGLVKVISEILNKGGNSSIYSIKRERGKSPSSGDKRHNRERDHISSTKFNMFVESEGESPSPPPPPVISENKKREESSSTTSSAFKGVKVSTKSRNYVRRNRRSKSRSPEITPVITTGDVDLRVCGPPEKHPRLNVFQPDTKVSTATPEEDIKKPLVEAANKDVDLRQLPGSPSKKRASMERAEQPPPKKSKAEVFDELFGNEDVDLRQLPPPVALVKPQTTIGLPLSPPPPPIISQPSPVPASSLSTSSQDSSVNTISSPKRSSPEREKDDTESHAKETKAMEDDSKENKDNGLKPKGWAKFKETYKSPLRPLVSFPDEMELPKSQSSTPGSNSPLRERDFFGTPRGMSLSHRSSGNFDKLGRPLLYHRLPDDPGERRRSLSTTGGEDTDMRRNPFLEDGEEIDINVVDMIIHQADEQLKNGNISFSHYNTLLKQVIHLNEIQKLREAQRRDQQENKENWERSRKKRISVEIGPEPGQLSPVSVDDGSQGCSSIDTRFGDIDERFPAHKPRNPVAVPPSVPSPPEPSMPASGKFSSGQSNWNDMNHPHESGRWEPSPHPWIRGGPASGPSAPINSGHLGRSHIRLLNQGQSSTFHRPPGPEFQQMNNFGGMGRWRTPQFQPRPSFENEVDRFEPRFSGHMDNRFRIAAPIAQDHVPRPNSDELPPADPMILDLIAQDTMRTINIDGVPREIRFYGDVAVVLLSWDDPREIGFQGGTRRVIFDERDSIICTFNDTYREFLIDGNPHRIRLGAPTRELYIDDKWYETCFGGPPITIEIGGKMHSVKLDGPPPQVKIGFEKRLELVAGKINLIINARNMVPVFLDAKPQRFDIEGKPHVLRFVEALSTVLINGQPIKVEFGGLPKPIIVRGKKHFIRFTVLPRGMKPGYVTIVNMEGGRLPSPPRSENENSNSAGFSATPAAAADDDSNDASGKFQRGHDPVLPVLGGASNASRAVRGLRRGFGSDRDSPQEAEHSRNSPAQFVGDNAVGPVTPLQQQPRPRQQGQLPLEMLTSLMPTVMAPATGFGYQVEQDSQDGQQRPPEIQVPAPVPVGVSESSLPSAGGSVTIPFLRTEINVDELFQKLVATGIVPQAEKTESDSKKDEEVKAIKPVDFKQSETLKVRQPGVVNVLYSGIQCSSCGVRFPPEQTMKYSQHLDWHFRQNRRDRDNTRKAQSRKWYYDVSDWIQFEEIEDLEERAQSWFETQQATGEEEKEVQEIPSVCAGENPDDTICDVCHDKFEQFYNEEREEWHLRKAVRVDGKTYHPLCYEDYKTSMEVSVEEPSIVEEPKESEGEKKDIENESEKEAKMEEVKAEETPVEVKAEAMDTSEAVEAKQEEVKDAEDTKTEDIQTEIKVEVIETELKEVTLEPASDENTKENDTSTEIKTEVENVESESKVPEESMVEEEIEPITTADTTHTAVACTIDGNVQFEESPQLATAGPTPGKIKINITKSLPATSKEPQNEGETETSVADQNVDSESGPVTAEASRESGEEGIGEEEVDTGEPPPPGVEPVQLKPRLVGRKLTELPPVMKGTELSGLCSIM